MHVARAHAFTAILLAATILASAGGAVAGVAETEPGATATVVAEGLEMPVDLAFGPDGTLYYVELQSGNLRAIPPGASSPEPEPLWSASALQTGGERGLVGLALDPDFEDTGAFYVYYTHNETGTPVNRLSKIVDGEETVLLDDIRSGFMHNSGRIAFLPDRTMLVSVGDATLDTERHKAGDAQDPEALNGKVLRLNRDGSVPADNPWGTAAWTIGHRNVYGLAVAPDGTVLGTENGPHHDDEVNVLAAGNNYGWPTCLGHTCENNETEGYEMPVMNFTPTIGPTGATWYRGHFYWADFNKGQVHRALPAENGTWEDQIVAELDSPRVLDVEAGPDGLYFSTWDTVYRVNLDEKWLTEEPFSFAPGEDDVDPEEAGPPAEPSTIPGFVPLAAVAALGLAACRVRRGC